MIQTLSQSKIKFFKFKTPLSGDWYGKGKFVIGIQPDFHYGFLRYEKNIWNLGFGVLKCKKRDFISLMQINTEELNDGEMWLRMDALAHVIRDWFEDLDHADQIIHMSGDEYGEFREVLSKKTKAYYRLLKNKLSEDFEVSLNVKGHSFILIKKKYSL